jgi:hypothetical protein
MLPSLLLATFLAALGAGLLIWHARAWQAARDREPNERELAFSRRQFRRRQRVSLLIVALGVLIAGGEFVHDPVLALAYWSGTLLLVLWIVLLAILDMAASQQHFGLQRAERDAEEAILLRQFRKDFRHQHNGDPPRDKAANGEGGK